MRLRCSTTGSAAGTEYVDIRNVKILRYKPSGSVTSNFVVSIPNISSYDELLMGVTKPTGSNVGFQLAFSDNGWDWSDYCGPDGTSATFYDYSGQAIALPGGYTGYYYKWKAILYSDGRETPIFDGLTIWEFVKIQAKELLLEKQLSDYMPDANPLIVSPIGLNNVNPRTTAGYPSSPAGGDYISEPLSGRTFNRREILLIKTYSETTVGQVLSGYVKDQNENINTGMKVIITSTYSIGLDQMGTVNPDTGFYQVFVKNTKYDGRSVIVGLAGKSFSVSYTKYGTPALLDGTTQLASPGDVLITEMWGGLGSAWQN